MRLARARANRLALALGLVSALSAILFAQQRPTFRSGVDIVLLDVNVVDGSHTPAADLKPEDFTVEVDHKARKVVSAQFLRYEVSVSTSRERAAVPVPGRAAPVKGADRPPARNVLIVIDNDSMQPGDGLLARREAAKFLDKLAPDDRIGVVTVPRMQSVVKMTKIREDVRAELAKVITGSERYRPMQYNIGVAEAFDVERGDAEVAKKIIARECSPSNPECPDEVRMEIRQVQLQTHLRGERSIEALRDLGESLRTIDGPKTVVYVTGGIPTPDIHGSSAYSQMGAAFGAAQVSLYTLYIHQELLADARVGRPSPTAMADMSIERDGVENATGAAGGTMMDLVGTFDQYFDRIVTELSGSYLVGIEVQASDRDGKPHQVSVKVNRKGLDVRARKQYVIEPPGRKPATASGPAAVDAAVARPPAPTLPANPAAGAKSTAPDLEPLVERMRQYVTAYRSSFLALLSDERSDFELSTWQPRGEHGVWATQSRRRLAAENLLVRREGADGWRTVRDVFEIDGQPIRERDGRLCAMLLDDAGTVAERAASIDAVSTAHEIGFVNRSSNVAPGPLVFLDAAHATAFVFAKQGEQVVAGVPAWQIAFAEQGEGGFVQSASGGVPTSGAFWVDPRNGAIVKTIVRWESDGVAAEIAVTYGKTTDADVWVPVEMNETYHAGSSKLECVTRFSNYRRFEAD